MEDRPLPFGWVSGLYRGNIELAVDLEQENSE